MNPQLFFLTILSSMSCCHHLNHCFAIRTRNDTLHSKKRSFTETKKGFSTGTREDPFFDFAKKRFQIEP